MTNDEMKAALDAANLALVEKLGKQPYIALTLTLTESSKWFVGAAYIDHRMNDRIDGCYAKSPEGAFTGIMRLIAEMPTEKDRDLREFQKMQAKLIDFGNAKGIETKWLNPIVENARALAENALTYQAAE